MYIGGEYSMQMSLESVKIKLLCKVEYRRPSVKSRSLIWVVKMIEEMGIEIEDSRYIIRLIL